MLSDFFSGLVVATCLLGVLWFAFGAWETETDARRAETEKHVAQMSQDVRDVIANNK